MKRLILMISLFVSIHAIADLCGGSPDIYVRYTIWNQSEYTIGLKFDEAEHGHNPDDIRVRPHSDPLDIYGCSNGADYKTRAVLTVSEYDHISYFDMGYLYINTPSTRSSDVGSFSFEKYNINTPNCECEVRNGDSWDDMDTHDCLSYTKPMKGRVEVRIGCK